MNRVVAENCVAAPIVLLVIGIALSHSRVDAQDDPDLLTYKQTDQGDLQLVLNHPPDWVPTDRRPAIVFFFGGGWAFPAINHFERQAEYFASRGLVSIRPYVRVRDPHGTTPAESVDDAVSAIRWIKANAESLGIDPARIVVGGGSSGGHVAACTAQCARPEQLEEHPTSPDPAAMVLFNPLLGFHGIDVVEEHYRVASEEVARQISPELHVTANDPPALILFGSEDTRIEWVRAYIEKSRTLGNRVDLFIAQGEDHAFFNQSPWYERTLAAADEFLVSLGLLDALPVVTE